MARTIWSTRFLEVDRGGPASPAIANVPDGFVWDLRDVNAIWHPDTPDLSGHGVQLNAHLCTLWNCLQMLWNVTYRWEGRQILYPGEELRLDFGPGTDFSIMVSGYQLIL